MHDHLDIQPLGSDPVDDSLSARTPRTVLAVGTEWRPEKGGVSAFNQRICRALADTAHRVLCFVPARTPEGGKRIDGVEIVAPRACPGLQHIDPGTLFRRPELAIEEGPSIIIGHDYITGPHAIAVRDDYFPNAKVVIIVHVSQLELQFQKDDEGRDPGSEAQKKHDAQKEVIRAADMVVAVGPHLFNQTADMIRELNFQSAKGDPPILPAFRLDPGMDVDSARPVPGTPSNCVVLQVGRTEHLTQKGFDIAAKALGRVCSSELKIAFDIRGCIAGKSREIEGAVNAWAANPILRVRPLPFDPNPQEVRGDLGRASLLLMPSREEGFGLVGLEAVEAGVPILITARSGLADLMKEKLGPSGAASFVVDSEDPTVWAARIGQVLQNRDAAFRQAGQLKDNLAPDLTWKAAARSLEAAWDRLFPITQGKGSAASPSIRCAVVRGGQRGHVGR